ncbi:MAG: MarC family protein [Candidatus Methanoperedens sp.]|nr:MarC family protein [Candidatus Methanoperedens sp.]MCZ7395473.1 MarC family protein [Candidatus Methanoperedens sp.]
MTPELTFFIYAFTSIFAIVNPVSGVMAFISMTSHMSRADKIYIAKRSVVIACIVAIVFSISGEILLKLFNITADSLRVAGGVLLFLVAIDMLFARTTRESITTEELKDASQRENISIFPIAMPLLTGPGAITTIIVLIKTAENIDLKLIVVGAILLTFLITFLIFRFSDYFNKVVGMTGMLVMTRLMGLFLGAIAVDFISTGIKGIFNLA